MIDRRVLLLGAGLVLLCPFGCRYIPESTFELSPASRLPKWIELPKGVTRGDVSVSMNYYILPWGGRARFLVQERSQRTLRDVTGSTQAEYFTVPGKSDESGYPSYQAVTVKGATELMEHRALEPVFYVTDDAAVWRYYRSLHR